MFADERPKKTAENTFSALQHVCDNADQFSQKLEKAVEVADHKITDWSRRIFDIRSHILGPPDGQNGINGANGYNGGAGMFGDNYYQGNNQYNNGGGTSIVSAYSSILPFFRDIGSVLSKVFAYGKKIASILFVSIPRTSRGSRQRLRMGMGHGPAKHGSEVPGPGPRPVPVKTRSKGIRTRKQPSKGRSRCRSNAAARRQTRIATDAVRFDLIARFFSSEVARSDAIKVKRASEFSLRLLIIIDK